MALIRINHTPQTTQVCQALNIIVPDPGKMNDVPVRKRKVLYLLHGLSDDASAWQRYTAIETIAANYGLVVIMPSVGRSFYTDQPNGQNYFSYLIEELPQYLSDVFDLSPPREDTLIAGVSMGGYGAMKAALLYPERFYAAASFSGFLSLRFLEAYPDDPRQKEFTYIFGDLSKLSGSEYDPAVWIKNASRDPSALPQLHIACGLQDDLYPLNQLFQAECLSLGINLEFHEEDAKHEWRFWGAGSRRSLASVLRPPTFV
jgi:S-formylglutathione hydrolase FrmB